MIQFRPRHRLIRTVATAAVLLVCVSLQADDPPTNASFSNPADIDVLNTTLTQFGTFRQGNPGTTLNFNIYNLGTTSPISLFHHPPLSIGDTSAIALQPENVAGLQPVGAGGIPNAPMQLVVSTNQVGNLQVSYTLEFSSDSLPAATHDFLAISAYATVLRHGDYNADGKVDAGDYVVWRKTRGQSVSPPYSHADDTGDGLVTEADYNAWRAAFPGTSGSGSSTPGGSALSAPTVVPEPATAILGLVGASFVALLARRRKRTAM